MSEMLKSFERDLADVNWRELKIHLKRDALITVAEEIDILAVAVAVAEDDGNKVEGWVSSEQLGKPTESQLKSWEKTQDKKFRMLIVQPYILIQEVFDA